MTREELLTALRTTGGLPGPYRNRTPNFRTVYEAGTGPLLAPSGHFFVDYVTFTGGCNKEVPRELIDELEREGLITKAFPDKPHILAWVLATEKPA